MAKQKESKPIYVTDKKDPRLKAYNDSLYLHNMSKDTFNPKHYVNKKRGANWYNFNGTREDASKFEKKHKIDSNYEYYITGKFPGKIQPTSVKDWGEGMSAPVYKKPTQPVIYQDRIYQKESEPIKSKSIKGMDSKLPDLKKVEGPSKWMRSFGAGATENYWSKVDASGKALAGYNSPNKNAVEQPAGPGEDYQVRNSIPLGATQFNKDKK